MRTWTWSTTLLLATTTLCLTSSPPSWADPKTAEAEPTKAEALLAGKVTLLKKGDRAPAAGVLIARETLLSLLRTLEARATKAEAAAERASRDAAAEKASAAKVGAAEVVAERTRADACRGDLLRREALYEAALKRCASPPSTWGYYLATGIGAVVGAGVCVGTVAASR